MDKERLLEELHKSTHASYVAPSNGVTVYQCASRDGYSVVESRGIIQFGDVYTNVAIALDCIERIDARGNDRYRLQFADGVHTLHLYFD